MDFLAQAIQEANPATCDEKFIESLHMIIKMETFPRETQVLAQKKLSAIAAINQPLFTKNEADVESKEIDIVVDEIIQAMQEFTLEDLNSWNNNNAAFALDNVMETYYKIPPKNKN